jgi:hypothetical protein
MINGGYYIKARKIRESEIAHCAPCVREIWDWLLGEANHEDKKVGNKTIKRGQCMRSYKDIQDDLHWRAGWRKITYSRSDCENAMKVLRRGGMITTLKTTRGMIINVVNYDLYQTPENYECHTECRNEHHSSPQTSHTINKNEKNDKKKEENTNTGDESSQDVNLFIDMFKTINPTHENLFRNKTERASAERLLKKFGMEKMKSTLENLPDIISLPYAPAITTPYELEKNLGKLILFVNKNKNLADKKSSNVI